MLYLFVVFALGCAAPLVAGVLEQHRHYRNLDRIPARIMVNGIRGKSSITRLCAGALRGGGLVTVAKTTGTAARFIHPDGSEEPVYRKFGIANVIEQVGVVRRAAAYSPDALVIECMAVAPDLQEINQSKLIRSTIGVLCNVREDHLAEMGPTLDDVARSLCRAMPVGGVCVTAERHRLAILQQEADRRRCRLIAVDPEWVLVEEMAAFEWITFKDNVAIALTVAELLGVHRQSALAGMWAAAADPGAVSVQAYRAGGKVIRFANVFAANDPESTLQNVTRLLERGAIRPPLYAVVNCRPDRIERNAQMGAIVHHIATAGVVLIGSPTRSARIAIPREWQDRLVDLGGRRGPEELRDGILRALDAGHPEVSLVAIGNIHGQGEVLHEGMGLLERVIVRPRPAAPGPTLPERGPGPAGPPPAPPEPTPRWLPPAQVRPPGGWPPAGEQHPPRRPPSPHRPSPAPRPGGPPRRRRRAS